MANPRLPSHPGAVNVEARLPRTQHVVTGLAGVLAIVRLLDRLRFQEVLIQCGIVQGGYGAFLLAVGYLLRPFTGGRSVQSVAKTLQSDPIGALLVGMPDRSTVDRFIRRRRFAWRQVLRHMCLAVIGLRRGKGEAILAIDETALERSGRRMEGTHWVHDGSKGRQVWGHQPVGAVYATAGTTLPFDIAFPERRPSATKHEVALEIVEHAVRMALPVTMVVFDGWYTQSTDLLRRIRDLGLHWLGRLKSDRLLEVEGQRLSVQELIDRRAGGKWHRHDKYRRVRYQTVRATLPEFGPVTVVLMHDPKLYDGDVVALICSDPKGRGKRLVRLYKQRWAIECVWRTGKQRLALGQCHHQTLHAAETHAVFCMMAMNFVQLLRLGMPPEEVAETVGEVADTLIPSLAMVIYDDEHVRMLMLGERWMAPYCQRLKRQLPQRTRWRQGAA